MTIKVSKPAKGLREAIAEIIGRGASVINGMTKGDAQDELEVSRKNWIINGRGDIDQRSKSGVAATTLEYLLDRYEASNGITMTQLDSGFNVSHGTTGTYRYWRHYVESFYDAWDGDSSVTLSFECTTNTKSADSGYIAIRWVQDDGTSTGTEQKFYLFDDFHNKDTVSVTFKPASDATSPKHLRIAFYMNTGTGDAFDYDFDYLKLEIGDTATPFESRSYAEELRDCQRYYYQTDVIKRMPTVRFSAGSGSPQCTLRFPYEMAGVPAITDSGTWTTGTGYAGALTYQSITTKSVELSGAASFSAGEVGWVHSSDAVIKINAEL